MAQVRPVRRGAIGVTMSHHERDLTNWFLHGNELPDDEWIDKMLYPEREQPLPPMPLSMDGPFPTHAEMHEWYAEQEDKREAEHRAQDRRFAITESNAIGTLTGPPRTPGKED